MNLDIKMQDSAVLAVGAREVCLDIFISSLSYLFYLPLSGRRLYSLTQDIR